MNENEYVLNGNSFKAPNTDFEIDKVQKMLYKHELSSTNAFGGMEPTGHYELVLHSWFKKQGLDIRSSKMYIRNV